MENEFAESDDIEGIHPETLTEKTPSLITYGLSLVLSTLSTYGWLVLFGSIIGYFLWKSWSTKYETWKETAEYHKNPDKFVNRENALQSARQRMQEEYEQKAREHAIKIKEEQERKRAEAALNPPKAESSTENQGKKNKPRSLRTGFNPMMSDTRSCSFRPGRRSGGG